MKQNKQLLGLFGSIALMVTIPSTGFAQCADLCTLETNSLISDTNAKLDTSNATLSDIQSEIDRTNLILDPFEALLLNIDTNIDLIYKALKPEEGDILDIYALFIANYNAAYITQLTESTKTLPMTKDISDAFIGGSSDADNQKNALSATKKTIVDDISSLSANAVFDGSEYDSNQTTQAKRYIKLLSGAGIPTATVGPDVDDADKLTNRNNTMAAVQSLSAYNLSTIVSKRTGTPEEKDPLGNVTQEAVPSSQTVLDNIYETMVSDETFLSDIATDTSMDIGKKSLYLLVGAFTALYRIEQNQQQLIATQSATNSMLILLAQVMADMQPDANQQQSEADVATESTTGVELPADDTEPVPDDTTDDTTSGSGT